MQNVSDNKIGNIYDIINIINSGCYLIMCRNNIERGFHKCSKKPMSDDEVKTFMNNTTFLYFDINCISENLDDRWTLPLFKSCVDECSCTIKYVCSKLSNIKHLNYYGPIES